VLLERIGQAAVQADVDVQLVRDAIAAASPSVSAAAAQ
jgi:hypothetical protein